MKVSYDQGREEQRGWVREYVSMILAIRMHRNTDVDGCGQRKLQAR